MADAERSHRSNWAQVHFSFITHQADLPIGEEALDHIFSSLGAVADVAIKQHTITASPPRQTAYGFVYFYEADAAQRAMLEMKHVSIDGIVFDCNFVNERDVDGDIRRKMLAKQKSPSTFTVIEETTTGQIHRDLPASLPSFEENAGGSVSAKAAGSRYQVQAPQAAGPFHASAAPVAPTASAASNNSPAALSQWTNFSNSSPPPHAPYSHSGHHYAATGGYPAGHDVYSNHHALFTTGAYHLPSLSSASTDSFGSYGIPLMHSASSDYDHQHHAVMSPPQHHHPMHAVQQAAQHAHAAQVDHRAAQYVHPGIAMMVTPPLPNPPAGMPPTMSYAMPPPQQPQQVQQQPVVHHQQHQHPGGGMMLPLSPSYDPYYHHQHQHQSSYLAWQQQGHHPHQKRNFPSGLSPPRR